MHYLDELTRPFLKPEKRKKKSKVKVRISMQRFAPLSSFRKQFSLFPASTGFFSLVFEYHGKESSASRPFTLFVSLWNPYHMNEQFS